MSATPPREKREISRPPSPPAKRARRRDDSEDSDEPKAQWVPPPSGELSADRLRGVFQAMALWHTGADRRLDITDDQGQHVRFRRWEVGAPGHDETLFRSLQNLGSTTSSTAGLLRQEGHTSRDALRHASRHTVAERVERTGPSANRLENPTGRSHYTVIPGDRNYFPGRTRESEALLRSLERGRDQPRDSQGRWTSVRRVRFTDN